ncbi:MAG: hypothetical protein LBP81_09205, partial [Treponema sp.]|nr:hypothetical protein [Treponema sp.]
THTLTDFSGLEAKLKEIADGIEISSEINFTMQTTQNDPGTVIRMTFDITSTTPSAAASSTRYIEGTLAYDNATKEWSLTNITYSPGISSESGAVIAGTASGSNVSFIFRNLSGYDPKTDTAKQWIKASTSSSWQINSEYNASGSTDTTAETMLVYLVLDASTSLQDSQITQIRTAVNSFIDTLYNRVHATE